METQIFHHAKIYQSSKKSSKRNPNPSRYYNSIITNQVSTQAKIPSFKNPHIKDLLLPRGQNPLSYCTRKCVLLEMVEFPLESIAFLPQRILSVFRSFLATNPSTTHKLSLISFIFEIACKQKRRERERERASSSALRIC